MEKRTLIITFAFLALVFITAGFYPLTDRDEGYYATISRNMRDSGDWIIPVYNGFAFPDKPPLLYWSIAISYKIFGVNEFAVRFPIILALVITSMSLYFLVRELSKGFGKTIDIWEVFIIFFSNVFVMVLSRVALTDQWLVAFVNLSILFYIRGTWWLAGIFLGLGLLTKGPIALFLFFSAIIPIFVFIEKDWKKFLWKAISSSIISVVVAIPWYYMAFLKSGSKVVWEFFFKHNIGRFSNVMEGHSGPVYYYIPVLFIGLSPWTVRVIKNIYRFWDNEVIKALVVWAFVPFIFFSLSKTKLPHYIYPSLQPLLLTVMLHKNRDIELIDRIIFSTIFLILSISLIIFAIYVKIVPSPWFYIGISLLIFSVILFICIKNLRFSLLPLCILFTAITIVLNCTISSYSLGVKVGKELGKYPAGTVVFREKFLQPTMLFYSNRKEIYEEYKGDAQIIVRRVQKDEECNNGVVIEGIPLGDVGYGFVKVCIEKKE